MFWLYIASRNKSIRDNDLKYNVVSYNCTTFVDDIIEELGLNSDMESHKWVIPDEIKHRFFYVIGIILKPEKNNGYYPGAAGEQIRKG